MADPAGPDPERFVRLLQRGEAFWQKSFSPGHHFLPVSARTGRLIPGGANIAHLIQRAVTHGFTDNRWAPGPAVVAAGGTIRPGERPTRLIIRPPRAQRTTHAGSFARRVTLYNVQQTRGLSLPPLPRPPPPWFGERAIPALVDGAGTRLAHDPTTQTAYYNLQRDLIVAPPPERYPTSNAYQRAVLHQLGFASGHPSRLNRSTLIEASRSDATRAVRARETLRADLHGFLMGERLGIGSQPQHARNDTREWISLIQRDGLELRRAARDAGAAATFLLEAARERLAALEAALYKPSPPDRGGSPPPSRALQRGPPSPPRSSGPDR